MSGNLSTLSTNTLTATESAKPSVSTSSVPTESNIEDMIGQINELGTQLAKITNQILQLMREYSAQQRSQQYDIQEASLNDKRDGIERAKDSGISAGILQALSGFIGIAGVGGTSQIGEAATHLSQAMSKSVEAAGTMASASITRDAEMDKIAGDFKAMNAQDYMKALNELVEKARQIVQQMNAMLKDLVELNGKLTSAVRN
ncbi:pathogenicity island effector protein [Vibrio sp. OCN044]|uniref:Pathogenicity island effector protein n=1 Tax=Vibrio tetraodonis subsp. pristinus TaxID=2695891 RepID=A0A6L8LZ56_9VIBR|nr:pathogenicity island effector protein [Vibrio tetraodonis]MYM58559.1 pathogenicity island effector protein [Vibrio tetraodonis subsp. pristinus]